MTGPVLVTGATGFVGSHVADVLHARGHRLRCTVREGSSLRWLGRLPVETVRADLTDLAALEEALAGVDAVVHVAGVTSVPRSERYRTVNVRATERLGRAASERGVRRFVFVSSLAARGPMGAPGPESAYGRSKRDAEEALAGLGGVTEVVALRPGGVYGPRDTDLLPLFRAAARGWLPVPASGAPLQPVYAVDAAEAVADALEGSPGFGPWTVVEQHSYAWSKVARSLGSALGREVRTVRVPPALAEAAGALVQTAARALGRAPPFDRRRARDLARLDWTADPAPTEEALGWRARVPLPEGLERTAAWYREEGWL